MRYVYGHCINGAAIKELLRPNVGLCQATIRIRIHGGALSSSNSPIRNARTARFIFFIFIKLRISIVALLVNHTTKDKDEQKACAKAQLLWRLLLSICIG